MSGSPFDPNVGERRYIRPLLLLTLATLLAVMAAVTASAAPRSGAAADCHVVIALYDIDRYYPPSFATQLEAGFGLDMQYQFGATSRTAGIGFAARVSAAQRRALTKEPHIERLVREGAPFVLHSYLAEARTEEWWNDVASLLRFRLDQVLPRFGIAQTRLTARQVNRVARFSGFSQVMAGDWVYLVSVRDGVDGIAKAAAWEARGFPARYSYSDWFSLQLPFEEIAALSTDPEIAAVEPNRTFQFVQPDTPPQPTVPPVAPQGCK